MDTEIRDLTMFYRIFVSFITIITLFAIFKFVYIERVYKSKSKGAIIADVIKGVGNSAEKGTYKFWGDIGKMADNIAKELKK